MGENRLNWFGHMRRRKETNAVRVVTKMDVEGKRRKEIQKKKIENNKKIADVCVESVGI